MTRRTVSGGCHCSAVRFEFSCDTGTAELLDCNCSICSKTGFLHLIVPHADFRLLTSAEFLTAYRFGTGTAEHLFCTRCGIKSFYQPRSHPEAWSVNWRCVDAGHGMATRIQPFDGRNWETARAELGDG